MNDKIAEIRARHADVAWRYIELPVIYEDRALLLAEVDRLRSEATHGRGVGRWMVPQNRRGQMGRQPIPRQEQKKVRHEMKTLFLMAFIAAMLIALGVLT
jgi:hypothetical protein